MKKAYLGLDIGSISTKAVIIDSDNNILLSEYIWTEGNPINAVKKIINSFFYFFYAITLFIGVL